MTTLQTSAPIQAPRVYEPSLWMRLKVNRNWMAVWFMLPAAAFLILFLAYPLGLGVWLSFTDARLGREILASHGGRREHGDCDQSSRQELGCSHRTCLCLDEAATLARFFEFGQPSRRAGSFMDRAPGAVRARPAQC